MQKTCCFSGHRPQNLPWWTDEKVAQCIRLKELLRDRIEVLIIN